MKKKILLFAVIAALALGTCACNKNSNTETDESTPAEAENNTADYDSGDLMVKHIKSIEPESRDDFLYFWQSAISYCTGIKLELKEIENTASYEFDPTDESQIPAELSEIYDFAGLKRRDPENRHKDFKLSIDGTDVKLSFDGMEIYPTDYGYSDIQEMIESLDAK